MKIIKRVLFEISLLLLVFLPSGVLASSDQPGIPLLLLNGPTTVTTTVTTVVSDTGLIWMDRNLGAFQVATSSTDPLAYGDLYQWGRLADGHQLRSNSRTTTDASTSDNPGHSSFIVPDTKPFDWRSGQNDLLWQGVAGTNNPCPSGFRVPTQTEWQGEIDSWGAGNDNAASAFASPLKLVMAGYRRSGVTLGNVGSNGYYWSSSVSGTGSRNLNLDSSYANMNNFVRAFGFTVRCLKD